MPRKINLLIGAAISTLLLVSILSVYYDHSEIGIELTSENNDFLQEQKHTTNFKAGAKHNLIQSGSDQTGGSVGGAKKPTIGKT